MVCHAPTLSVERIAYVVGGNWRESVFQLILCILAIVVVLLLFKNVAFITVPAFLIVAGLALFGVYVKSPRK